VFSNNKKQYINILQQNKQLKLDYRITQDEKILKQEQSSFLITDETMPKDALFKLDTLQKIIPHTYLISLFEGANQKIIPTSDVDVIGYESVNLSDDFSVAIPKNEITSASRYFSNSGIDYILSPFSILNEYIQDKSSKNSLNVLAYNNVVYTIIINNLKQIVHSEVKELTPFDEIQDENFSDDIIKQKLYEEVHFLEIQQFLNEVTQNYYEKNENVDFLENVNILYTLKPLNDEQIKSLYETIMVDINYNSINIEEYINNITQKDDSQKYNFVDVRAKKESGNIFIWILFALISMIIVVGIIYYKMDNTDNTIEESKKIEKPLEKKLDTKKVLKKVKKEIVVKDIIVKVPNHIIINNQILQDIYMLFDIVPYDAVLKDLEINKDSSTYVCNFAINGSSLEDMQSKTLNIYKDTKILLKHKNKAVLNTIIENNILLNKRDMISIKEYEKHNFLSTSEATTYLIKILSKNSTINYISKNKKEHLTYNFKLKSLVKTPKDFFNFIEKFNKQQLPINIKYPILFSKINDGIEIKYNIELHQQNKKQIKPKK